MSDIDHIVKTLNKELGDFIQPLSELADVEAIPFGIPSLDYITGIGGCPRGRLTEIFGGQSGGKSSLCLSLVAEAQKLGLKCAYIDLEFALTKELATLHNVKMDEVIYVQPVTGEDTFKTMEKLLENDVKLIIIDSVSAMLTEAEEEKEFGEQTIGLQARMMSAGLRKLIGMVKSQNAAIVFINQVRDDIAKFGFGPKTTTSGGKALRFYASLRLNIERIAWVADSAKEKIGMTLKVTVNKNKVGVPQKSTEVEYYFLSGFDKATDALRLCVHKGFMEVKGKTYYQGSKEIGNKKEAVQVALEIYNQPTNATKA